MQNIADTGPMIERYPDQWSILLDKGYDGAGLLVRAITPQKQTRVITMAEVKSNKQHAANWVIVENFFGRMKQLWGLAEKKYCYTLDMYDHGLFFCVALTNFPVSLHPLRNEDGNIERNYMLRLVDQYHRAATKRKEQQQAHLARKRARLNVHFGDIDAHEMPSGQPSE